MNRRLDAEASLYLQQHADQPVDWFPWGEAAFAEARRLDRPVFVSIGYSSCHWCHVMARESFADPEVGALLNQDFVAVKVDREEHPEVDAQYMAALLTVAGRGGWPLSAFCLPDGRPFFAGTYYPPQARWGQPAFADLLRRIRSLWRSRRSDLEADAVRLAKAVRSQAEPPAGAGPNPVLADGLASLVETSLAQTEDLLDGLDGSPRFPPYEDLWLWLEAGQRGGLEGRGEARLRQLLDRLAWSGLRDQVGGAFHRYCVDAGWRTPHFEQLLSDNAAMLGLWAEVVARFQDPDDQAVLDALVGRLAADWLTPGGWLAAAFDADDPVGEGGFYTWTPGELRAALDASDADWAMQWFRVAAEGSPEERSPLWPPAAPGRAAGFEAGAVRDRLAAILPRLAAARAVRPRPARDDKGVVAWNGLALTGLAAIVRQRPAVAREPWLRFAGVLRGWAELDPLPRAVYPDRTRGRGQLEDHAALALGLWRWGLAVDDPSFVEAALRLGERTLARFRDTGGFISARDASPLGPPAGWRDSQTPSPFGLLAELLGDWALLAGDGRWTRALQQLWQQLAGAMSAQPRLTRRLWRIHQRQVRGGTTVVLSAAADGWYGQLAAGTPAELLWLRPTVAAWAAGQGWGLLQGRVLDGPAQAWICSGRSCLPPAGDPAALAEALRARALPASAAGFG